jgi:G3E family GTPase
LLSQIRAADRLILTKTDAAPPGQVARLLATLNLLSPGTPVLAAVAGVSVTLDGTSGDPFPVSEGMRSVSAVTLPIPNGADWAALSLWLGAILHAHGDRLIRIKGVVQSPAGRLLIQTVRNVVQRPEVMPPGLGVDDNLAVLGEAPDVDALQRSLHSFLGVAAQST